MTYISRFGDDAMSGNSFYCLIGTVDKYKNLSNIQTGQYPTFECCLLENILYLCDVFREKSRQALHIESVFALSLTENLTVFNDNRTQRTTLILVLDKARCAQTGMPRLVYTSVGYCIVYRCHRFCQSLRLDKRNNSTLSFCVT